MPILFATGLKQQQGANVHLPPGAFAQIDRTEEARIPQTHSLDDEESELLPTRLKKKHVAVL
jgi:hypothetical protein